MKKDGLIYEYGYTADARLEEAQGRTEAMVWSVNKISDTQENYIHFVYQEDRNATHQCVTQIHCTGNSSKRISFLQYRGI